MSGSTLSSTEVSVKQERILLPLPRWDEDFVDCHLPSVALEKSNDLNASFLDLISAIKSASSEAGMYGPTARLLNRLSEMAYHLVHGDRALEVKAVDAEPPSMHLPRALLFIPCPRKPPAHDIFKVGVKPDILAIFSTLEDLCRTINSPESILVDAPHKGSLSETPPSWSLVESAVESKPDRVDAKDQVNQYADTLLRYRPDKTKAVCLTSNQYGYVFYVSEPCGVHCSRKYGWDEDLTDLFRFVYSFYSPTCNKQDPTFSRAELRQNRYQWHVSLCGTTYDVAPVLSRKGAGRRTWIGIGTVLGSEPPAFRIVKDMWRDDQRRFEEGALLKKVHEEGCVPGVVRLVASGTVQGLTAGRIPNTRTKHRLVMGSSGCRLSACRSVLQFLKVMYDALEAHQHLVERGILHRDMSWYNILCNPRHYVDHPEGKESLHRTCIADVMGEENPSSCCLITDFDNSAALDETSGYSELTHRTGTPMFIAVDISGGEFGHSMVVSQKITTAELQLDGEARQRFISSYSGESYDAFNAFLDSVLAGTFPTKDPFSSSEETATIVHQPFHDVESMFWVIVWFLMRTWPEDSCEPEITDQYKLSTAAMLGHRIGTDGFGLRKDLLRYKDRIWERILHSECRPLASMLANMAAYLGIRWLSHPDAPPCHSHEALKRLLLKEIVRMTHEGKPIFIKGPRPIPASKPEDQSTKSPVASSPTVNTAASNKLITPEVTSSEIPFDCRQGSESRKRSRSRSPALNRTQKKARLLIDELSKSRQLSPEQWLHIFSEDRKWFQ
ncbi:hypothetical protein K439DRAFT_1662495 [Ramaria rubella]|nr:hypothetical protein K439DRAFT_1662495 [Ramaria rubella]